MGVANAFMKHLIPAALPALILTGCSGGGEEGKSGGTAGQEATEIVFETVDGEQIPLSQYGGKIVVLSFFATWSKDTGEFVETMNRVQLEFEKNVNVVAVAMDRDGVPAVRSFIQRAGADFPVYVNGARIVNRFGGAKRLPTTYVLLRNGKQYIREEGLQNFDRYKKILVGMYARRL